MSHAMKIIPHVEYYRKMDILYFEHLDISLFIFLQFFKISNKYIKLQKIIFTYSLFN